MRSTDSHLDRRRFMAAIPLAAATFGEVLTRTFIGSANCYRQRIHMNMTVGTDLLPPLLRRASLFLSELLMGVIAIFMVVWGLRLVQTTWGNSVDEFPWLSVGITYLPIVVSGAMMLLFVVERLTIGPPPRDGADAHIPVE